MAKTGLGHVDGHHGLELLDDIIVHALLDQR
jgi:hypothetical protein